MSLIVQKVAEMDICNAVPRYSVGSFQKPNVEKVLHSFVESHQKNHSNLIFRKSFALSHKYPINFLRRLGEMIAHILRLIPNFPLATIYALPATLSRRSREAHRLEPPPIFEKRILLYATRSK